MTLFSTQDEAFRDEARVAARKGVVRSATGLRSGDARLRSGVVTRPRSAPRSAPRSGTKVTPSDVLSVTMAPLAPACGERA
jgi:hypothetical protein